MFAISETALFGALLLISKGWKITRLHLPPPGILFCVLYRLYNIILMILIIEKRTIGVALILLLCTLLFFSFYNNGYYFLSLMIMYFFMLPKIFTSITRNTRALETQLLLAIQMRSINELEIRMKIRLFKRFRTSVIIYLASILLANSLRIVISWELEFVNYILNEVLVNLMVLLLVYNFAPYKRLLFSTTIMFDINPFPLFNIDDLFSDREINMMQMQEANNDINEIVVLEYPYDPSTLKEEPSPTNIPLALGVLETQRRDSSSSSGSDG
jgi:hypothetical protein